MALVTSIGKITEAFEMEECIMDVFLDFSMAFDIVDHDMLLQKTAIM